MQPLVSIIIPVYNASAYLENAIRELLKQTYQHLEIIIVDDASTDNSLQIAKQNSSEKVIVISQDNAGAASARNNGLKTAKGVYVQFMDIDDFLSYDKISKQVLALSNEKNKVAVCNYINFNNDEELPLLRPNDQSSFIFSSDNPIDFLLNLWGSNGTSNFIQTNSWLVPRTLIDKAGGWHNYRCPDDDGEFFSRILLASDGVVYVPNVYNYYRRTNSENKLSSNSNKKYLQNTLLTIGLKYSYVKAISSDEKVEMAFAKQYLDFAVHNYPQQKVLSAIAYRSYNRMNQKSSLPLLGGKFIELLKRYLGWRFARIIKHTVR
jgi:glycosyltransferase involved in cell wall biosynthesis